jgi:DNA-binding transcriptional ArsR family regulator
MLSKKKIEGKNQKQIKILFWRIFSGSKGGVNRVKIILELKVKPLNTNQLSRQLQLDYKVVERHLQVLEEHELVINGGDGYGALYLLSPLVEFNLNLLDEVSLKSKN